MKKTLRLKPRPLSAAAFRPFGDVMEIKNKTPKLINENHTRRYHDLAAIDTAQNNGKPLLSIFRARPRPLPMQVRFLERHPLSSQAFHPLRGAPYLVLVAPPGEAIRPGDLQFFRAGGDQGVNYHRGVWHHYLLALDAESDFLVVDRGGEEKNCDEFYFSEEWEIFLES